MNFGALAAFIMITLIAVWGRREKDLTSYIKCVIFINPKRHDASDEPMREIDDTRFTNVGLVSARLSLFGPLIEVQPSPRLRF